MKHLVWWEVSKSQNLTLGNKSFQFVYILSNHNKHSLRVLYSINNNNNKSLFKLYLNPATVFFAVKVTPFCKNVQVL